MKSIEKYSISLFLLILLGVLSWSCSSDFLDRPPTGSLDEATYLSTEDAGFKLLVSCYTPIYEQWTYQTMKFDIGDQLSDDFSKGGSDAGDRVVITEVARGNPLSTSSLLFDLWNHRFNMGIGRCNVFLDLVTPETVLIHSGGSFVTQEEKLRWIAEARFLRAFYYYDVLAVFANVPIIDKPLNAADKNTITKSDYADVLKFILGDLDAAISEPNIPSAKSLPQDQLGRITKEAAMAFRARVNMFDKNYDAAKKDLKDVIDSGCYDLIDSYEDLFNSAEKGYKSKEAVFVTLRNYSPPESSGGSVCPQMNLGRGAVGGWGGACPTNDLVSEYEAGDPRLVHTILASGDIFEKPDGTEEVHDYSGYDNFTLLHSRKQYPDFSRRPTGNLSQTDWTFYHIRYADVLLMYAECLIETNGDKQEAVDILNKIRYRAFVTTPPADKYAKFRKFNVHENERVNEDKFNAQYKIKITDDLRAAVRHERRVELGGEGLRLFDLIRWGIFVPKMQTFGKTPEGIYTNAGTQVTEKTWPYPIPQKEIDNTEGSLTQNDNYK
ncbi:MAG: RagB/SusD family nutrient uptake outer membrane protein [Tannerella sp.]|jgi:hypothetical protein|nr:RagB/SusD family nutrient uptake outer membrane protein [Tannerella sp.]